jgi:hypothetical protein
MFNEALLSKMKRSAYIVETTGAEACDRDAAGRLRDSSRVAFTLLLRSVCFWPRVIRLLRALPGHATALRHAVRFRPTRA